jgi:hypothetical protein
MLRASEFGEQPVDLGWFKWRVDFDGGVAGDRGGDAMAAGFGVFDLLFTVGDGEDLFEHALEFFAFESDRGGFDSDGLGAEGLGLEAVAFELVGEAGEGDHLRWKKVDKERHEKALTLDALNLAVAENLFEENTLVGDVLVDNPQAFVVDGENEGVAELAERTERGEGIEGTGFGVGLESRFVVADWDGRFVEGEATGRGWNSNRGEGEGVDVVRGWSGFGTEAGGRKLGVEDGRLWAAGERSDIDEERC